MKTDEELIDGLRRATRTVRPLDEPLDGFRRRRARKRNRQRLVATALALLMVAGVVAVALSVVSGMRSHEGRLGTGGLGVSPQVARSLEVRPGEYFYLREVVVSGPEGDGSLTDQRTWWATDGSGELRFDTNRPDKYVPYPPEGVYGKGELPLPNQNDLSELSTDPQVLLEQLRERSGEEGGSPAPEFALDGVGRSSTGRLWRAIRRLFEYPNALPQLRAALFEVAAGLPEVTRTDGVEDPFGRDAVALELLNDGAGGHWLLFFDPSTHQLMSESEGWGHHGVQPIVVFESGIVGSRGADASTQELLFPRPNRELAPPPPASPSVP